jgi:hypothetical protein
LDSSAAIFSTGTVPLADVLADFHGSLDNPQPVLFASCNYFFALGQLVTAFGDTNPQGP